MRVTCHICPHHCSLAPGQVGLCRARINRGGSIESISYGRITSIALDPIEKKPLARFHPGSFILSVGTFGCNLRCPFCQNHEISMADASIPTRELAPDQLVILAQELANEPRGNLGVAFTYNEPFIGWEYLMDSARLLKERGLLAVLVTNGMVTRDSLTELLPYIDAMNIDLKGFRQEFYDWVGGDLDTVKATIEIAAASCHVEVTTLVIPGRNDSGEDMEQEAAWLASVSEDIPLHISRFFPRYHVQDAPPTDPETIYELSSVARRHLRYVYPGNC